MRLLKLNDDGDLSLVEYLDNKSFPPYAILSHTWGGDNDEVTFKDVTEGTGKDRPGYQKLTFCAKQAARDNLQYFWLDTCCIDKSSSAELSEAINSMFRWYKNSQRCYVYLSDVEYDTSAATDEYSRRWKSEFKKSRWFTRGWTLQELIAPASVEFFSRDGIRLGDKDSLKQTIHDITGIAVQALQRSDTFSIEERMSWAKGRETKRDEDAAYSLLGIFNVQMPLLYGEGRQKALNRLRKEIRDYHSIDLPVAKGAAFNSHLEEHSPKCLPNTRTELLQHIRDWARSADGKPIFWLSGMAGTGKSTIARTIAQSFSDQGQLGATFFFKKGEGERGNATRFFTTIAADLVAREPRMLSKMKSVLDEDPTIFEKALKDQFEKLIVRPLQNAQQAPSQDSPRIVVIDALDECEKEDDIRTILQLLASAKNTELASLRILVTSRPELPIRIGFKQMSDGTYQDVVLQEVPKGTIEHDIRLFLEHKLGEIRQQRMLPSDWPETDQIRILVELATPLFIYASTVCRYIGTKGGDPEEYLDKVLKYRKSTFSQLDRTYLPVLDQLLAEQEEEDREDWLVAFQELVGSIVILESPLSTASLAHLLQITQRQIRYRLDALHSVLSIPQDEDTPIRLLHLSFRDFLVDPQKDGKSPFWIDARRKHEQLASRCIELMASPSGLRQDICNLVRPGTQRKDIPEDTIAASLPPELQYACRYWVDHLVESVVVYQNEGIMVLSFLRTHLLHWLEAMSLLGETHRCIHDLNRLRGVVKPTTEETPRVNFLYDAYRFTLRFRHIIEEAPLQIYHSVLLFAPIASIVRKTFVNHVPELVETLSKKDNDWSACYSILEGHSGAVNSFAFSPDGELLASASWDESIRIWETSTGICRSVLSGHTSRVNAVVFSPDGLLVVSASSDNTIRFWDTGTWSHHATLTAHDIGVETIAYSPDGQCIASGSMDCTIKIWDISQNFRCTTLEGHTSHVNSVVFSPDGQLIASGSSDFTVRIWHRATASCQSTFAVHTGPVSTVAFSLDGRILASTAGGTLPIGVPTGDWSICMWDVETRSRYDAKMRFLGDVKELAFPSDSRLLSVSKWNSTLRMWNTHTWECEGMLEPGVDFYKTIACNPRGYLIASGSISGMVYLYDLMTVHKDSELIRTPCAVSAMFPSPSDRICVVHRGNELQLWDTKTGAYIKILASYPTKNLMMQFSPDGQLFASVWWGSDIELWDTKTWSRRTLDGHEALVQFAPDSQLLATISEKTIKLWNIATESWQTLEAHSEAWSDICFSPNGQLIASKSLDNTIRIWDVANGSGCTLSGQYEPVGNIAFSADSLLLASASYDKTIKIWDLLAGSCRTLEGHSADTFNVKLSPNNQVLASIFVDKTIGIWHLAEESCLTVSGHSLDVQDVNFSPDSQLLVSTSYDKLIKIWDVSSGSCLYTWNCVTHSVNRIAFSADGMNLHTERGSFPIPEHLLTSPHSLEQRTSTIYVSDKWIFLDGVPVIWLPPEYRTNNTDQIGISGDTVCLGNESGKLTILRLHVDEMEDTWQLLDRFRA